MIQINPLKSYIDGGVRAALTTPPSASLVFDLPGKAIWVKGVKLKGTDHTYTFNHDNYITLTNTPDKNNPESEDIKIGVNITTLKNVIDTTYNGGTLALLQEGLNTEERTWQAKILHSYINDVLPTTKNLQINGTNYAIYTTANSLPQFFAPTSLGTTGQILACTSSGLSWIDQIQNTDYRVSQSSTTSNSDYRIILKQGANNNPETDFVRFSEYLTFNPYTKTLKINNIKVVTATDIYVGSTAGLVPSATSAQQNYYLRGDGAWVNIATEMAAANTWRPIKVGNTDALGSGTNTGTLSFIAGTGITLTWDATNKRIIITNSSPDINHNTDENVRQVPKTDNVNRPLMMINGSTSAGEQINTSMFSTGIYANASTKMITANGFIKAGSSDDYVLLGGGSHKTLSDFSMAHSHPYLPLSGGTLSGSLIFKYGGNNSDQFIQFSSTDSSDPQTVYLGIRRPLSSYGLCYKDNNGKYYSLFHEGNYTTYTVKKDGTGASGTWNININGNATQATNLTPENTAHYFRDPNSTAWRGGMYWGSAGSESMSFIAVNSSTRFQFVGGSDIATWTSSTWQSVTPYLTIYSNGIITPGSAVASNGFIKSGYDDNYILLAGGGHKAISDFATSGHTHSIYAANENYGGFTKSGRLPISGFYQSDESESDGNAPWSSWMHLINCQHSNTGNNYALQIAASFFNNNTFKIRVTDNNVNNAWRDIIHSGNIGSQTVANTYHLYINSANTWSTWYWSGQSGQPSWLWGSNDGTNMYVWNPSNFSVNYANSAGSVAWTNITGKPINFKAYSGSLANDGWKIMQGNNSSPSIAIAYNNSAASWNSGTYSATLVYGCSDTRGLIDCAYSSPVVTFGGCSYGNATDDAPNWYMKLSGTHGVKYNLNSMPYASSAGNADTVDGYHASAFATAEHNHDGKYLRKDTNDSTPYQYTFTKTNDHAIRVGTVRGTAVGSQTGEYIHLYERVAIGSPSGWGSRPAPSYGLATYGGAWLATDTGNVGIGTTSPSYKLHVVGDIYSSGNINSSGCIRSTYYGPGFALDVSAGSWAYMRYTSGSYEWHIGENSSGGYIGSAGAFEIRSIGASYSGLAVRYNTSSYGKVVVSVPSGECSIGYYSNGAVRWTVGCSDGSNFGWYQGNGGGWKMTLDTGGNLTASNFYSSSDIRLKDNINNISKSIRSFNWKESGQKSYGLIAQEIEDEYPELVSSNDNGYKSINYTSALCMLVAKLENGVDKLKEKVKQLEDKLSKYENTL